MIRTFLLIVCFIGINYIGFAQAYSISPDVKRIVFLGNSITYKGEYIEFIDAYYSAFYPDKPYELLNLGLPSETVSGLSEPNHAGGRFPRPDLHERLNRVLEIVKPDLVFACYGMNDGIYLPFNESRFNNFKEGINRLHEEVKKSGSEIIHITPPIYDERKGKAYANVLDIYSDWLISNRYTNEWNVIDIHWPMKMKLEAYRNLDSTFVMAKDGVHPNEIGHFIMAKHILLYLGETSSNNSDEIKGFLLEHNNGLEILKLVQERQQMTKDSWITFIGHSRPNMNKGLPMNETVRRSKEIEGQIQSLVKAK